MLVLKFGGTSVGSPEAIRNIIDIVKDKQHAGNVGAIVVSAFSRVTDSLIELAQKACGQDEGRAGFMEALRTRHCDTIASFLKGDALLSAASVIERHFLEMSRILDGIAALGELSPRTLDLIMSFGERLSAALLADIFRAHGINAYCLDARPLVKTNANFGNARFIEGETFANIRAAFAARPDAIAIVTGFIGSTDEGAAGGARAGAGAAGGAASGNAAAANTASGADAAANAASGAGAASTGAAITTTLGRGGSDLTAAIFGAALDAQAVEIWTDVDGMLTADPKYVKDAFLIEEISYIEAMELSHFGAKVLYPPTVRPALAKGIPIWIRSTFNPQGKGTWIKDDAETGSFPIRGISSMNKAALLRVQGSGMVGVAGFSSRLFGALARRRINIILITQSSSEYSICFAILPKDIAEAEAAINDEFRHEMALGVIDAVETTDGLAIIAVVGAQMRRTAGSSGKVFHALGRNGINVVAIAQGSSELNISAVIPQADEAKALNAIHEAFFLSGARSVNLFLTGVGLIGGTLLEQLADHREFLADEHRIRINLVGVADSKHMLFSAEGFDPRTIKAALKGQLRTDAAMHPFDLDAFIGRMRSMNLPNSAFCDCTASDAVAGRYDVILQAAIPIITPNKRANSGDYGYYKKLTAFSRRRGIPYLYETTVCAGLPVISTLRDLFLSGDKVRRIEAVLSGTLSYIFNNFDGTKTFSALVREAKAKGYTEPDPRDDLNAMDAARKALVLARECGMPMEFSAVSIEPILGDACFQAATVEGFFAELEKSDPGFESRRAKAAAAGKSLRYVAVIENGAAKIALREEAGASPFRSLTDADNIVVITSDRYSSLPMVIKGPGAGAHVTAGGVFADIVRIARTLV